MKEIGIPIGRTANNKVVTIPIVPLYRNHCFIAGEPGSGKSVLINNIIKYIVKNYDKNEVMVWTCFPQGPVIDFQSESVKDFSVPGKSTEDQIAFFIRQVFKEADYRSQTLYDERAMSYTELYSMPLLIVVIDELSPMYYVDDDDYFTEWIRRILEMSHATGISLLFTSQLPNTRLSGLPHEYDRAFNIRIVLRGSYALILEALYDYPGVMPSEISEAAENLSRGKAGDFILHDYSDVESCIVGRIDPPSNI